MSDLLWRIGLFFAQIGFFKYEGLVGKCPWYMPRGRVKYADGYSIPMSLGNAVSYAKMFNGTVERVP